MKDRGINKHLQTQKEIHLSTGWMQSGAVRQHKNIQGGKGIPSSHLEVPAAIQTSYVHVPVQRTEATTAARKNDLHIPARNMMQLTQASTINQTPYLSGTTVVQLHGERKAMKELHKARGINQQPVRRGNRKATVLETKWRSRARILAFQAYIKEHKVKQYMINKGVDSNFINQHYDAIMGSIARQAEIGNCGEFADMMIEELTKSTSEQWIHKCQIADSRYDHNFVVTYPTQMELGRMSGLVNMQKAIVADAWDGYKVMNLESFCQGGNCFGQTFTPNQIQIDSAQVAEGIDYLTDLSVHIRQYANEFDKYYKEDVQRPTDIVTAIQTRQPLSKYMIAMTDEEMEKQINQMGNLYNIQGVGLTQGYEDLRPMSTIYLNEPPYDDDYRNATAWWTHQPAEETIGLSSFTHQQWEIFHQATRENVTVLRLGQVEDLIDYLILVKQYKTYSTLKDIMTLQEDTKIEGIKQVYTTIVEEVMGDLEDEDLAKIIVWVKNKMCKKAADDLMYKMFKTDEPRWEIIFKRTLKLDATFGSGTDDQVIDE